MKNLKHMKKNLIHIGYILALSLILTSLNGCAGLKNESSYLHDRRSDYLTSQEGREDFTLPEDLPASTIEHDNDIPEIEVPSAKLTPKPAKPPGSLAS